MIVINIYNALDDKFIGKEEFGIVDKVVSFLKEKGVKEASAPYYVMDISYFDGKELEYVVKSSPAMAELIHDKLIQKGIIPKED